MVSTETRCVKLRNKDLSIIKDKSCLELNLIRVSSTNRQWDIKKIKEYAFAKALEANI